MRLAQSVSPFAATVQSHHLTTKLHIDYSFSLGRSNALLSCQHILTCVMTSIALGQTIRDLFTTLSEDSTASPSGTAD